MKYQENPGKGIPGEGEGADQVNGEAQIKESAKQEETLDKKKKEFERKMNDFISGYERNLRVDDFSMNSYFCDTSFTDIGYPELGVRWALAYLRKQIDEAPILGVSHTLHKAYERMYYDEKIDSELRRDLGEMLGQIYEVSGRFSVAYRYYRENCPDKYSEKLGTVVLDDKAGLDVKEENRWYDQVPSDRDEQAFPDFHRVKDRAEGKLIEQRLLESFLKKVPEDVMKIDTRKEYALLMEEARKIIEKFQTQ